jgi:class 3 adenylate cyclase/predicted ATPase
MFCDLVGSSSLSEMLDPEDLRGIVGAYQQACAGVVLRFEGHIAQYLGDGLLVYFGYPLAHEDDAQRAVRAGLGILTAMKELNGRLDRDAKPRLAVRLGVHTGFVVVGEIGGGPRLERLALGETPNLAARLQSLAEPDTIVVSDTTYRLVDGLFVGHDLGPQRLKGFSRPVRAYRVTGEGTAQSRLEAAAAKGSTSLVGREHEMDLLLSRWEQAKEGLGQVVLLNGDAGIGKSRLVEVLKARVAAEPHTTWEWRCSPYYADSSFYPVIEFFQRVWEFESSEQKIQSITRALDGCRLAHPEAIALWASFLSVALPHDHPPLNLTPQRQRQKTLESIVALLLALAEQRPVLLIVEDLHWADPSTLELLGLVLDQVPTAPVMAVFTFRPDFRQPWRQRMYCTSLTINRFSRGQTEAMVQRVAGGKQLPAEVVRDIVAKTDGVPLFVEELTKMVVESGLLQEQEHQYNLAGPLPPLAIPATLQDSLMARLDRLATVKEVAQLGSALGRTFSYDLLLAVSPIDGDSLRSALASLVEAELLYQRGVPPAATYVFKHALIQEAAYHSLLRSTRQIYHQRIATALEARFPEMVKAQPELAAHHFTEAGLAAPAIRYWQRASEHASRRSAHVEAISHTRKGLAALEALPETPEKIEQEFMLRVSLGASLIATKGWAAPDVEDAYNRARELAQTMGETPQLFRVLWGLCSFYIVRAEHNASRELAEQLLKLARGFQDPGYLVEGELALGMALFCIGEFATAREHLERSGGLYHPREHHSRAILAGADPGVFARAWLSHALWHLGYADRALVRIDEAISLAQELSHPFSLALALDYAAMLHQFRGEPQLVYERAEAARMLSVEQGFEYYRVWAKTLQGWALAVQGQKEVGLAQMRHGVAEIQATGAAFRLPYYLALLAEACRDVGEHAEGLKLLADAVTQVQKTREFWTEAELYRLRGELLLSVSAENHAEAERCFHGALDVARRQQARGPELRAATSLSRLWKGQGRRTDAHRVLAESYGWFTEGFDTADLRESAALLRELE